MSPRAGKLPAHVQTHIETTTGLPIGLSGGQAKPGTCPTCGRVVLVGYDAPVAAFLAVTDPYRLTPALDAAAWILDRATYRLHGDPGTHVLERRTTPGAPNCPCTVPATETTVLAEHKCGRPLGGTPIPLRAEKTATPADSDPIPY